MKKIINFIKTITNLENTNSHLAMLIGGAVTCALMCAAVLWIPAVSNNTTAIIVAVISILFIIYAATYIIRTFIRNDEDDIHTIEYLYETTTIEKVEKKVKLLNASDRHNIISIDFDTDKLVITYEKI